MLRLGVGNKRIGADKPWHHEAFMVDEEALLIGYCTMAATVVDLLHRWPGRYE
jgi:metal-dependent amidase/aminoacylase/carboxypeptidase family protein